MNVFKPAMTLMNRLKYPQKFGLISFVFLLPLILLIYLLFSELQNHISFSQKETLGNEYLRPLNELLEDILQYKILNESAQNSATELAQITRLETEISTQLTQLTEVDRTLGGTLKTTPQLNSLQQTWQTLVENKRNWSEETKRDSTNKLLNNLDNLRFQVGDQSNLILDPDLDTYYLMDTTLLKLPEMQKDLADIQVLTQRLYRAQSITPGERSQLITLRGTLKKFNDDLKKKMEVAFTNNPANNLRPALAVDVKTFTYDLDVLVEQLDQFSTNAAFLPTRNYVTLSQENLKQSFQVWDKTIEQLDWLIQRRIDQLAQRRWWTTVFVLTILAIATYLFIGFYQGVMQVVSTLSVAAKRMIVGNTYEAVQLNSRDELADVVRSFNDVADALREAEANYRGIFENAPEGIFQTTLDGYYLTANPSLAKIYGYDSPAELVSALTDIGNQLYVQPDRREQFAQLMQTQSSIQGFESEVYRKDRSTIWISESARLIQDSQGQPVRYEGTVEDISQRKQAEAEIAQLTQKLKEENLRMGAELEVTRQLQQMLLPTEVELEAVIGLEIAGFMEPAAEVGGDYYDVLQQDGKVQISIGDVTGHGLESGVVMIMAQTAVRTLLANGETDPAKFLNTVNHIIYENTRRMRSRKNMTLAVLEYEAGMLRMSGQHEELIIVRANGDIEPIDTLELGFPLGLESDITSFVFETEVQLQPHDLAVLYTDGITEAMNAQNQQYGLECMYKVLKQNRQRSAQEIRQAVIHDLMQHIGAQRVFDDITLLILKQK